MDHQTALPKRIVSVRSPQWIRFSTELRRIRTLQTQKKDDLYAEYGRRRNIAADEGLHEIVRLDRETGQTYPAGTRPARHPRAISFFRRSQQFELAAQLTVTLRTP